MIDVRCPLCKNRYSCAQMGMIPFEHCGMFVIDDTIKRHKTNADRIRGMSDEELADWLDRLITHCNDGPSFNCFMQKACLTSMIDWLKQEVKSNDS